MNALHPSRLGALALAAALAGCASAPTFHYTAPSQPEAASGYTEKPGWTTAKFAVAAANPLATDAGYQVLKAGGSRGGRRHRGADGADAGRAAVQRHRRRRLPAARHGGKVRPMTGARPRRPQRTKNCSSSRTASPWPSTTRVVGGRSVGVPGTVRMLELAHRRTASCPGPQLFQPAIRLAEEGFQVSPRLHTLLKGEPPEARPGGRGLFLRRPTATPWPWAHLKNPELAAVLRDIAARGSARPCTRARWPRPSWTRCASTPPTPASSALADLAGYQPREARGPVPRLPRPRAGLPAVRLPAAELGRHRRRADPGHPGHTRRQPAAAGRPAPTPPTGCTSTPRPRAWPLPTARSTWPTPTSCSRRAAAG
jgi:gamma-glutamyltranspeptidase/glutathione hydrolase